MIVKYFYERTDEDFEEYNKIWEEKRENIIFLHKNLSIKNQLKCIIEDITDEKNILAVRFISQKDFKKNNIINDIILGIGIKYQNNKLWLPLEVWIYN